MLTIHQSEIINVNNKSRLSATIDVDGRQTTIWFEVENEYKKYLCPERSDAFIVGALQWAMRTGHDITCVAPVTQELLYNLHEHLIPVLFRYSKKLYQVRIAGPIAPEPIEKCDIDGVGTGMSCGVDSFYAVLNHYKNQDEKPNLTHLCVNSTGSFQANPFAREKGGTEKAKEIIYNSAREIAAELELPLIESDSNIYDVFPIFVEAHTYTTTFAVLCMQKLWKTYFFASSRDYSYFTLTNHENNDCAFYDLLSLNCFSTRGLRIYSEGSAISRLEKVAFIADSPVVQKHMHCCFVKATNCAICYKCRMTMLMLDVIGKLDNFSERFPIDYYRDNIGDYLAWVEENNKTAHAHAVAIYPHLHEGKYVGAYLKSLQQEDAENEGRNMPSGIEANKICIMDVHSKETICKKHASAKCSPISAKILTCIIAIEKGGLDKVYGFVRTHDEELKLRDLLYGMMLDSRNDFADAIAMSISGSIPAFVAQMNAFAKNLHMNNSHFTTPTGLDGYSTVQDTAILTCYALQNPLFCEIIATPTYVCTSTKGRTFTFNNTNHLIHAKNGQTDKAYSYCTGGKTAVLYGKHALISVARKDDKWHVVVQADVSSFAKCFDDAIKMHEWAFSESKEGE